MKRFNMKTLSLVSGLSSLVLLMACGDDITNDSVVKAESYDSKADLPQCSEKFEGAFATIPSKKEVYVCTEGSWKSLLNSVSAVSEDGKFACSTVELSSKNGYKVVCGGDSVAVVTNGAKGDSGDKGSKGPDGLSGDKGSDGSGSNGRDLTLPTGDCAVLDAGLDYVVYDCGDSTYVRNLSGYKATIKTWNALSYSTAGYLYNTGDAKHAQLFWFDAAASDGGIDIQPVSLDEFKAKFAATKKVKFTVAANASNNAVLDEPPSTNLAFISPSYKDIRSWGGLCVTYSSEKDVELTLYSYFTSNPPAQKAHYTLKGTSGKESTVNLLWDQFQLDKPTDVIKAAVTSNYIIAFRIAGGTLTEGEYENEFSLYEFGAYNNCNGPTINKIKAEVLSKKGRSGSFTDKRNGENYKYNTVTIDGDVWMAQNLRVPYTYNEVDAYGDEILDVDDNPNPITLSNCPTDDNELVAKGCLYYWSAAIDSVGMFLKSLEDGPSVECGYGNQCSLPDPLQGICPTGWHLPTKAEKEALLKAAGYNKDYEGTKYILGRALAGDAADGDNWLGFSATQTGYTEAGNLVALENTKNFYAWTTKQDGDNVAASIDLYPDGNDLWTAYTGLSISKQRGVSVRCVQDKAKN